MRAEAEAPFRGLRLVLLGFFGASAGMGFLISVPQLIGALGGARSALPLDQVIQNMAIDAGAVSLFAFFFYRDWQQRAKQINRLKREEGLGALPIRLASGKTLRLEDLRGNARVVVAAGTPEQVSQALQEAEPLREELIRRGVIVVPLPLFKSEGEAEAAALPPLTSADQRWRVEPLRLQQWEEWFAEQLSFSPKAKQERGLFVGLRLDGRVRSSGSGSPPWRRYALELAPLEGEGKWTGFMDGFDGRV
ncbi:hypothetical protein HYH03_000643 [Edaphochlamys debaryana]|uniref:Uncharacterized protein n=1 Tax=Edaphochlamys debaryana TaxID=47281 RepID=A0A835YGJ6_9CHLO|nr:hypothetical protein HYH03_000643 [Edaphochlamys debaryana]|eukprot:KAG2502156.1 hypothetical protein HYH03_000643 [Edaphochlamys debaryana]